MLVRLSIIFLAISTLITGGIIPDVTESQEVTDLLDLPLKVSNGLLLIYADFYNSSKQRAFSVREMILVSESAITGKIQVWNDEDGYDIHYQFDRSGKDSKERLVIHDKNCTLYTHSEMIQNANLFGDDKPLRDLIMMTGPSIIYRIAAQSTVSSKTTQHGLSRKFMTTAVNKTLEITLDIEDKYDFYGVEHPKRIEFNGYDRSSKSPEVRLSMDIVKQMPSTLIRIDNLKYRTQPSPGIGCPNYLIKSERKSIPKLLITGGLYTLLFNMNEEIEGSTNNRVISSEIMASGKRLLMWLQTNLTGVRTKVFYDNELGIILTLEEGDRCQMTIRNKNSPGCDANGYFKLENLFYFDGDFNYIGKTNLEKRFLYPVDAWESVQFNVDFQGNKVDKFVVTQYFIEPPDSPVFNGYSLVQTMISIYNSSLSDSSQKSYVLAKRIKRDYMHMQMVETERDLYDYFTLNDCKYLLNDRKVTLNFKIACEAHDTECVKLAKRRMVQFKENFIDALLLYEPISPLRIDDIQYHSSDSQIEMNVTFLDKPNLDDLMKPRKILVSKETFDVARTLTASDERECLHQLGHVRGFFAVGIWRSSDSFCGYLRKFENFKEDTKNGDSCNIYIFPFENSYHISHELALDDLQKSFLKDKLKTFSMKDPESQRFVSYKIIDIVKLPESEKDGKESDVTLYHKIKGNSSIKIDDKTTLTMYRIETFGDCLRFCQKSEGFDCNSFSFCADSDFGDCRVSSLIESNFTDAAIEETNSKCSIFTMNAMRFYSKVPNRKFKKQISTAIRQSATSCAQMCLDSDDCISFQYCGYSCSFNRLYTDSTTEYDEDCIIYYPKVSHEYRNTGNKIVSKVIHTEMNLNLDQCASLCHGWTDGDTECKSFNYCPRNINQMESSCSLTKFSVKSSDSTEGGHCFNYEFITQSNDKNNEESSEKKLIKGASGSNAFGITMMFLIIVSLLIFSAPCVYEKIKPERVFAQLNESLTWTKQVNQQPGITNLNMSDF